MSRRSTTSERSWLAALALVAACGGGSAPAPPDLSERDRELVDTDRALYPADAPANDSQPGYDGDRAEVQSDPPPISGGFEPPNAPATGGRGAATGGTTASGGRRASGGSVSAGGFGGRTGTGGRTGAGGRGSGGSPDSPPPASCVPEMGCQCGNNLCAACECVYGESQGICASSCN
jgi:hypothetical protein